MTERARLLLALALLALLALGPGVAPAAGPLAAGPLAEPAAAAASVPAAGGLRGGDADPPRGVPFTVTVDTLSPASPRPQDTLVVAGRIAAAEPLTDVTVRLRVGRPLTSRSALARADGTLLATSTRGTPEPVADSVPAGSTRAFQLVVPAAELRLESLGVHPLHVEVRARAALDEPDAAGAGELTARTVQTFLPTFPEPVQPTRLAVLLPLTRAPVLGAASPTVPDLAAELGADGRLRGLLEAGAAGAAAGVPVTWVVDPALLDSVRALAAAAPADPGAGLAAPGAAAAWLERARAVLRDAEVLALPYADPDVVALLSGGLGGELDLATEAGRQLVVDVLGVTPLPGWVWPADGLGTPDSLAAHVAAGAERLLLDPAAVTRPAATRTTPDAATAVEVAGRELPAVTTDAALTDLLDAGPDGPAARPRGAESLGTALALQRVAAETALLTAERPRSSRGAVLAPPRLWSVEPAYARELLTGLAGQSWTRAVPLTELATVPPPDDEPAALAEEGVRLAQERALSEPWVQPLASARASLAEFAPVLTDPAPVVTPRRLALLRGASAVWRDASLAPAGREVVTAAVASVAGLVSAVRVEGGGPVLFTAETGTIPLTVVNELDQPVVVQVAVDAAGQARLLSGAVTEVQIEPGRRRQVDVRIVARTSGQFPVDVRLRNPAGTPLGPPARVTVRSTAYGRVAVAITVGAAAVLVAASGVRLLRRAWRTHRVRGR